MKKLVLLLAAVSILAAMTLFTPAWLMSLATVASGTALVVIGLLVLWRSGLVPFGQALYFATGAYTVALIGRSGWTSDAFLTLLAAACVSGVIAFIIGFLLARYREIFFAMLSLALSMILYGILVQSTALGSSDGLHVKPVTFIGMAPTGPDYIKILFLFAWVVAGACAMAASWYLRSVAGGLTGLVSENGVRIEYLGYSVQKLVHANLTLAGILAGLGGGITALSIGHVDPSFAYWTTSGEFVFVTILAGAASVTGALVGAVIFVLLRSTTMAMFPAAWQFFLGAVLLLSILFLPQGIGAVFSRKPSPRGRQ